MVSINHPEDMENILDELPPEPDEDSRQWTQSVTMADVAFRPALRKPLPPPRGYGHPSAPPAHLSEQTGDDTNSPTAANAAKASPGAASPPRTRDTHQQLAPKWTIAGFKLMVPCASSGTAETAGKAVINPTKATAAQSAAATSPGLLSSTPAPTPTPASKDPHAGTYPQTLSDAYRPVSPMRTP